MTHTFDTKIAEKFGVESAIILQNLFFWVQKNKANEKHYYDGNYWTYNTAKGFAEIMPYMNHRQITYAIQTLIKEKVVIKGEYNKNPYDRTSWFALSSDVFSFLEGQNFDSRDTKNGNSYTDSNTDNKQIVKDDSFFEEEKENETVLLSKYDFSICKLKEGHPHRQLIESGLRLFSFFKKNTQNRDLEVYTLKEWLTPLKVLTKNYNREQIEELLEYANADKFWGAIVLNTDSLQRNFEKIKAQLAKTLNEK